MKYALWLSNIKGIGVGKRNRISEEIGCAKELYQMSENAIAAISFLRKEDSEAIIYSRKTWEIDREWARLAESGIGFISKEQAGYPKRLRNIVNAPYSLFYKGKLPNEEQKAVAIVGARGRSAYGSTVARELGKTLASHNIPVIGGLARGIDADGHAGALSASGETYAVLGCGVNVCYPRENRYLYEEIIKKGGVISEYPPDTQPNKIQFPQRNRIISGLSDAVVVVEAREKSGSLITADYAMEQGKEVYAVPGRITDPLSKGCNALIAQGAGIYYNVESFQKEMELWSQNSYEQIDFSKFVLEKGERLVYSLVDFEPKGLDILIEESGMSFSEIITILDCLQNKGFVRAIIPNLYVKNI